VTQVDDAGHARLRFTLIGPFAVERDGELLPDRALGSLKGRTLLKLLAVERGRTVPLERIEEVLWEGRPPDGSERNVATLVSRLRGVLGTEAIGGGRGGYRVVIGDRVAVDLDEAERFGAEAESRLASGQPSLARVSADRALSLFGSGRMLEDEPDAEWLVDARRALDRSLRRARRASWRAALELRDHAGAVDAATAALGADPFDEEAARALMSAHDQAGEPGPALAVYEDLRERLSEELGVDPAPETRALLRAVLREEAPVGAGGPVSAEAPTAPTDPGFVGRDDELAALSGWWAAAAEGRATVVLITGEAGIGKTRLAAEVIALADRTGGLVLQARCQEAERSLFLEPVLDALRSLTVRMRPDILRDAAAGHAGTLGDLIPEVGAILKPPEYRRASPEIERRRSFEAITALLRHLSTRQPVLLVLDDLQNAGASTLEVVHFLARRTAAERLLIVATLRSEEEGDVLERLGDVAQVLEVGPLSNGAVSDLARAMGVEDLVDPVLRRTRGHTLFVVEALRSLHESPPDAGVPPVPGTLRAAVLARTRRAGPEVEEYVRAASTLGPTFDLGVSAALLDLPVEEAARRAEGAIRARLVAGTGASFAFANDLIQEVLYESVPLPTRIDRHRRAAALLEGNPEAMAGHAEAAGDAATAAVGWLRAGDRAAQRWANRDAHDMFDRAIAAARAAGDRAAEAQARLGRGRAREALTEYEGSYRDFSAAAELARAVGDRGLEVRSLRGMASDALIGTGRPTSDCIPYLEQALRVAREMGDRPAEVSVLNRVAVITTNLLRFDQAYEAADRALETARELDDEDSLVFALDARKTATAYAGDLAGLHVVLPELEAALRRRGDLWFLQWVALESAFPSMAAGQWAEAIERIELAIDLNSRTGFRPYQSMFASHLGWIHRSVGAYEAALTEGRRALEMTERHVHPWWTAFSAAMLGWTLTELHAVDAAVACLERGLDAARPGGAGNYVARCLAHLADARWRAGDEEQALRATDGAEEVLRGVTAPPGVRFLHGAHAYLAVGRVRLAAGDPEGAERATLDVVDAATDVGWVEPAAEGALLLGRARAATGDAEGARAKLEAAQRRADAAGLPAIAWRARAARAALARRAGRREEADEHIASARLIVAALAERIDDPDLRAGYERGAAEEVDALSRVGG
jgi:DNA-binding SARP family transcriptional activator/tetratricopeptide (TPR) repeat protein